ncbi:hypothetical protein T265_10973 [Opisthorchis viverrini]|uniref:Uncharacterized protein n=1 Tax=Opisthorchis viverrini TaxID=6198 RepID=A0A074Z0K7_OPIVI|nr:hypothetical protein T265_10973 [Opisthorchis viverrini]KER20488.1 hypothetical protein T265_10973 [Opisthorchis viverrini]
MVPRKQTTSQRHPDEYYLIEQKRKQFGLFPPKYKVQHQLASLQKLRSIYDQEKRIQPSVAMTNYHCLLTSKHSPLKSLSSIELRKNNTRVQYIMSFDGDATKKGSPKDRPSPPVGQTRMNKLRVELRCLS